MIIATINTGTIDWTVFAESEEDAYDLLVRAYEDVHVKQWPEGLFPGHVDQMARLLEGGEVEYREVKSGLVYRDGEVILDETVKS